MVRKCNVCFIVGGIIEDGQTWIQSRSQVRDDVLNGKDIQGILTKHTESQMNLILIYR